MPISNQHRTFRAYGGSIADPSDAPAPATPQSMLGRRSGTNPTAAAAGLNR